LVIWKADAAGRVAWANRAYLELAEDLGDDAAGPSGAWRPEPVFPGPTGVLTEDGSEQRRLSLPRPQGTPRWFDVTSVRRGTATVHFAIDAGAAVAAEQDRKAFVQTLTKTFAQLQTGLAVFDRDRRLVLFNPAFLELTGLPAAFLSARPAIQSVLDRLRDTNMLPEPKNYASWRDRIAALQAAAEEGTYRENWPLPTGRVYRVTGRPHPNGAIALLFEDISDEISQTRRFRTEQATAQAVLDSLEDAVAVFSPAGTLTLCNAAYEATWGAGSVGMTAPRLDDEIRRWEEKTQPTPFWQTLSMFAEAGPKRQPISQKVLMVDGRSLTVRLQPLSGGSTSVSFRVAEAEVSAPFTSRRARQADGVAALDLAPAAAARRRKARPPRAAAAR
jgi:PAS domain-containing protein